MDRVSEKPILFSAPMVRALMADIKRQTRRECKFEVRDGMPEPELSSLLRCCPYGQPGDQIYVKETFYAWGRWATQFSTKKGRDEWHFIDMTVESGNKYRYAASMTDDNGTQTRSAGAVRWWKRPAIFMPRAASRITLEIVAVRVEQLSNISEADALAEGVEEFHVDNGAGGRQFKVGEHWTDFADIAYRHLWEQINGRDSLDANPYVWAIEFKRIQP